MYRLVPMAVIGLALFLKDASGEDWLQLKGGPRHSGDVPERRLTLPLGLVGAVPLSDAVLCSPVVAEGRIYAVDASGTAFAIDGNTLEVIWKTATPGGPVNCNNVSSPAIAGDYLHFGTTAGSYFVLRLRDGSVVKDIACGEPIFSAPVTAGKRVYFATLGSRVYAVEPDGTVCWTWDFLGELVGFRGDRWDGAAWLAEKKGRVTWRDAFCCATDIALDDDTVVLNAGGRVIWLEDAGQSPRVRGVGVIPNYVGSEYPASFGQCIGEDGTVYQQWHRRDNAGRVEMLRLSGDGQVETSFVPGTQTAINLPGLMSFCAVSVRGNDVFRCRPEAGFGFCKHSPDREEPEYLGGFSSIASPILAGEHGVYGGLDGKLYVVPLDGSGKVWSFATAFGCPISASACVSGGRIYFGCEDGYLYVLGPGGESPLPAKDLEVWKIRYPLTSRLSGRQYDWFTNYGDMACTNANNQDVGPPFRIKWIRRYEGTFKHLPVCGDGRCYIHTAEGQIIAVEQETGRLLWRRYWPDVYLSFTSPLYFEGRLLVPQAGMQRSRLRCLDAATGKLQWEAPFSGSPSWSRQGPPVIHNGRVIYAFGSGKYAAQGSAKPFTFRGDPERRPGGEEVMSFIYTHNNPYYPRDNKPLLRAWDLATGQEVWTRDFSEFGSGGNDCGLCLMDDTLYYSTFFGYAAAERKRRGQPAANGLTAAIKPATGEVLWTTTDYYVTAGCTLSGKNGRLYLGGYNRPDESTQDRFVWCLDARDGSLVWRSDPVPSAVNVVTVGDRYIFTNASGRDGHILDPQTGKIVSRFNYGYACTRFTLSEPYIMGANMDLIDLANGNRLVTTGPAVDSRECVGSVVSNGRIFYTSQASGLQVSLLYGKEAAETPLPWRK